MVSVVVMGVAGCGKSSLGAALARALALPLVEGDDHHPQANRDKMRQGIALTDADRDGWLATLAGELAARPQGVVLTCSALKKAYRDRLREGAQGDRPRDGAPGLRFLFLDLDEAAARRRVASRPAHLFPPALVSSQFAALERPDGEPGVLRLDALAAPAELLSRSVRWLQADGDRDGDGDRDRDGDDGAARRGTEPAAR